MRFQSIIESDKMLINGSVYAKHSLRGNLAKLLMQKIQFILDNEGDL